MNITAWENELGNDFDKSYILNGIRNGFDIIDPVSSPARAYLKNHPSARPSSPLYQKATEQVLTEIENGNYVKVPFTPKIVSPLGVIPKPDGGVRLIHDCSRPEGLAVNDYAENIPKHKYSTVDSAARLVSPNCYMAKVDLKSAYRVVPISDSSQTVTGIHWEFKDGIRYFIDKKLPFGSRLAPSIFHRLSQAVVRIMSRKGFSNIVAYLDDFFICESSKAQCIQSLNTLICLLRRLGFMISWNKVVDPTHKLTFLGIEIDSLGMHLRLPDEKLHALKYELDNFSSRCRASKKQLQSLIGKLNWASSVVYGGRVFLRRLINAMSSLKKDSHKLRFNAEVLRDLAWWHTFLQTFNGKSLLLEKRAVTSVYTDACNEGAGGHWGNDWFYTNWSADIPTALHMHINEKEVLAVCLAAHYWAPAWANKRIIVFSDNMVTVSSINKCTSRNSTVMHFLRYLFWLSARFNFHLSSKHIKGKHNCLADCVSRLHEGKAYTSFVSTLQMPTPLFSLLYHMSIRSLSLLLSRHGPKYAVAG